MTDATASTRGRALLLLIPLAVVVALGMLTLATGAGHFLGAWLVTAVERHPDVTAFAIFTFSGMPLLAMMKNAKRKSLDRGV
jgi:hypothetical protein